VCAKVADLGESMGVAAGWEMVESARARWGTRSTKMWCQSGPWLSVEATPLTSMAQGTDGHGGWMDDTYPGWDLLQPDCSPSPVAVHTAADTAALGFPAARARLLSSAANRTMRESPGR
jgi:hypothetical protein